jgi:hypothetical protein
MIHVLPVNIIAVGTTDGTDPTHVCFKEGYFHYELDNLNLSHDLVTKLNSYGYNYNLHFTTITYILQVGIMTNSLTSLTLRG